MKKALKIFGFSLAGILFLLTAGLVATKLILDATYFNGYDAAAPLNPVIRESSDNGGYMRYVLEFNGWRNDRVPTLLMVPKSGQGPAPCVIFLHGIGQDKDFVEHEFDGKTVAGPFLEAGYAFVTFDQYMRGERRLKNPTRLQEAKAFRLRPAYTVNDTRRLIDYLQTRPDIAPNRIFLAGASYGAITGSTVAAFDKRIQAVALTYGGGNLRQLLHARMVAGVIGRWMPVAQTLGWLFLDAADPLHYVGQIAPRTVFLQNGTNDRLIATSAAKALQDAARDPKIIKWYDGDHIGSDKDTVVIVLKDILNFIKEQDAKLSQTGSEVRAAA